MRYDSVELNAAVVPGVRRMSLRSVPIAHGANSVDNEGTLGMATTPTSFLSVSGVRP